LEKALKYATSKQQRKVANATGLKVVKSAGRQAVKLRDVIKQLSRWLKKYKDGGRQAC